MKKWNTLGLSEIWNYAFALRSFIIICFSRLLRQRVAYFNVGSNGIFGNFLRQLLKITEFCFPYRTFDKLPEKLWNKFIFFARLNHGYMPQVSGIPVFCSSLTNKYFMYRAIADPTFAKKGKLPQESYISHKKVGHFRHLF